MSRPWRRQNLLLVALICTGALLGTSSLGTMLFGQAAESPQPPTTEPPSAPATENPAAPAETPTPATPADDAAADDAPAAAGSQDTPTAPAPDAPAADPVATKAAFTAKLDEWKEVLRALRALTPRYSVATPDEVEGILKEWDDLIAQGEALIPQLRETGQAAYASTGGSDRATERFLAKLLADDIRHDRYEDAYGLGNSLISNGCETKEVLSATGVAAFCTNDFDGAETLLKRAQDTGGLSEKGKEYLALLDEYKAYWEEEQAIRAKEAAADDLPRVKITTTKGELIVELLENEAPGTVGNFIHLIDDKQFYDGLSFHRVLPGFMAQGGCPQGDGSGGPGYQIKCETDAENHRKHFRGSLSMAHAGKDTGGSQFFLTFVPTAHLNGKHTVFGRVIQGMDVLAKLQRIDPSNPGPPTKPDAIVKMEVLRKREHEYKPTKSQ